MKLLTLPDPANLSRRERLLVAGSVLVVLLVILDRVVLGPWWQHAMKTRQDIRRLEEGIRVNNQLLSRGLQIHAEADAYQEYLATTHTTEPDMASLLREIESLGTQSGISLGEVKPLPGSTNPLYQEYTVEVHYRGSLEQWIHFMYLLQTSKALFAVERATAERSKDDPSLLEGAARLTSKVIRNQPPA